MELAPEIVRSERRSNTTTGKNKTLIILFEANGFIARLNQPIRVNVTGGNSITINGNLFKHIVRRGANGRSLSGLPG